MLLYVERIDAMSEFEMWRDGIGVSAETLNIDSTSVTINIPENETRIYDSIVLAEGVTAANVTITKTGSGKFKFPKADIKLKNYFSKIIVEGGALITDSVNGTWDGVCVTIKNNAGIEVLQNAMQYNVSITVDGDGYVYVPEGVTFKIGGYWPEWTIKNATVTQKGKGVIELPSNRNCLVLPSIDNSKWIVEEGTLRFNKENVFGANGNHIHNRMWTGEMGEFVIFDEKLSLHEEGCKQTLNYNIAPGDPAVLFTCGTTFESDEHAWGIFGDKSELFHAKLNAGKKEFTLLRVKGTIIIVRWFCCHNSWRHHDCRQVILV